MKISDYLREADKRTLNNKRRCRPGERWDPKKKKCVRVSLKQRNQEKRKERQEHKRGKNRNRPRKFSRNRLQRIGVGPNLKKLSTFALLALRTDALKKNNTKTFNLVQAELKRRGLGTKYKVQEKDSPWFD